MGRMRIRHFAAAAVLAAAIFALTTCSNPIDLVQAATVEVMKANDRYLEVVNLYPLNNAENVSPGATIWVEFDRPLDESTISVDTIDISPSVPWVWNFSTINNTLSIQATFPGTEKTVYSIILKTGLKGMDGRSMVSQKAWAFETAVGPSGSVVINSGNVYTTSNTVSLGVSANGVAEKYRYAFSKSSLSGAGWNNITTRPFTLNNIPMSGIEGQNTVYFQFANAALTEKTSEDNPINDTIILDSIPPVVSSFSIDSNALSTSSTAVILSQVVSDSTSGVKYMQFMNTGSSWSINEKPNPTKSWNLSSIIGTRQVSARFTDFAGNTTTVSDLIILGPPAVTSATLNNTAVGTVKVSYSTAPVADVGTDYCRIYRRDYPSGSTYTYLGQSTGADWTGTVSQGSLYYFHTAIYNSNVGTSNYSDTSALGYTSNIAIIYGSDYTPATTLKTTLTNSSGWKETYSVSGTMPSWSVTLIPESLVSSTYASDNVWYGYPVIITAGTTLNLTKDKVRNVTAHGKGVVAMGGAGAQLLDVVNSNWTTWGYAGTKPSEIGWGPSGVSASSKDAYTWFSGNLTWTSPLTCPPYIPTTDISSAQLAYTAVSRVSVYRASNSNPTDGGLYCRDNIDHYFPVVRQGRFLQYGFYSPPLDRFTGMTFTVNLVYRMSAAYYP